MKVGFVYSEKYSCYDELLREIIEDIKEKVKDEEVEARNIVCKSNRKKYDLYVILSDDIENLKNSICKFKCKSKAVLITENLSEEYIRYALNDVIDIVYAKNNIENITNRIIDNMRRFL